MTTYRVPVFLDTRYFTYTAQFEGESYRLVFGFNERTQSWYLDVADDNDIAIIQGIRVTVDYPLGGRVRDLRMPPGSFIGISLDASDNTDPLIPDLGRRYRMLYFDEDDLTPSVASALTLRTVPTP